MSAVLHWAVSFLGRGRSERVATFQQAYSRAAVREYGDPFERRRAAQAAAAMSQSSDPASPSASGVKPDEPQPSPSGAASATR